MPSRVIRSEIVRSKSMARVSEQAEGLFWRLILFADDFGRFDACAAVLKGALYPLRESVDSGDVLKWLRELHDEGCVHVYMAGGHEYGQLTGWERHRSNQKRGKKSRLPGPTDNDSPASPEARGFPGDPTPESCVLSPGGVGGVELPRGKSDPPPVSESAERCRRHLVAKLLDLSPTGRVSRKRGFGEWDRDMDRLLRLDKRTEAEVIAMIDWALGHEFWCSVIQSPANLRDKWDKMELQRRRGGQSATDPQAGERQAQADIRRTEEWLKEQRRLKERVEAERAGQ